MLTDNRNARDWGNESMITDGNRHIDRRYMLIREKVKLGHIAIVWTSGDWNISDTGTKAIDIPTTERLTPLLCGYGELPIPAQTKILFGPVERPERRESTNKAIPLKILNAWEHHGMIEELQTLEVLNHWHTRRDLAAMTCLFGTYTSIRESHTILHYGFRGCEDYVRYSIDI